MDLAVPPSRLRGKSHWHRLLHFADALAFRGRSPSVTKRVTHLLVFIVFKPHWHRFFVCFVYFVVPKFPGISARSRPLTTL